MQKKQNRYFIQEHLHNKVSHGGIGNVDIERILISEGFKPIAFPYHYDHSFKAKCFRSLYLLKILFTIPPGSVLFFQFPLYARMHDILVNMLSSGKSVKIICLIADINGLKDGDEQVLQKEISRLRRFRYFIVHGKPMENWLKKYVPAAITSRLCFFDFLSSPDDHPREKAAVIAFAGNLVKSPFIEKLHLVTQRHALQFNVYGPEASEAMLHQPQVLMKGSFEPYDLPAKIEGAFGLLWDGKSIEGAGGSFGNYMQYISHHKLSLYVLAGLPVIVYEDAGSAEMVKALHIGFTVKTLYEIEEKIARLTADEYQLMRRNMLPLALRIASGTNLKDALSKLPELIN